MTTMDCCICGVARNCGKYLPSVLKNMENLGTLFNDYKIIIVYDDSIDNTLDILKNYADNNPKTMILYINNRPLTNIRTNNIATARNICLHIVRKLYSQWGFFIMMDCDDVNAGNLDVEPLKLYLDPFHFTLWDALSFNREPYYDLWALSIYPYIFSYSHFVDGKNKWNHYLDFIFSKLKNKREKNTELISVYSAFNGFAIYKMNPFIKCVYDGNFRMDYIPTNLLTANIRAAGKIMTNGFPENGDCEHRFFHFSAVLNYGAKIRISPLTIFTNYNDT